MTARTKQASDHHVIAPVLAGIRKPNGRPPNSYARIDRDYDTIRAGLRALFTDLGIQTAP